MEVIIARLDHHGEATDQELAPDLLPTPDFLGEVGLNFAIGLVTSSCSCQSARWRPAWCWPG